MIIPIGDDVNKHSVPIMATILIAANIMLWVHTGTLARAANAGRQAQHAQEGDIIGTDFKGTPIIATRELITKRLLDSKKWERFVQEWGLVPTALRDGELHRALSYMFIHADFWHLLGNMVVFWVFVGTLEATLGSWMTLIFYLFWGLITGLLHAFGDWGSSVPSIGSDGAIAGVIGAYLLCFGPLGRIRVMFYVGFGVPSRIVEVPSSLFMSLWLFLQVFEWTLAQTAGFATVGWLPAIGGFAAGMGTMLLFHNDVRSKLAKNKEGAWEVVAEEVEPQPSGRRPALAAPDTVVMDASTKENKTVGLGPKNPVCDRCGTELEDGNRVMDQLYRCPKCKLLSDTSLPALPKPNSSARNRQRASGTQERT
jgi:membrane associated rhomboid family serine protease